MNNHFEMDEFLLELLRSRSPTGVEREAADIVEKYVSSYADSVSRDVLGNRIATLGAGAKTLMLAGHMDEIGFIVSYIDENGFVFFETLGGHDNVMLPGRRVTIMTRNGYVYGVTGKRAVHLMDAKERKEVPEIYGVWIDIGAKSKKEAQSLVEIGDSVVYDTIVHKLSRTRCAARAFDDRADCYCAFEALRRAREARKKARIQGCERGDHSGGNRHAAAAVDLGVRRQTRRRNRNRRRPCDRLPQLRQTPFRVYRTRRGPRNFARAEHQPESF